MEKIKKIKLNNQVKWMILVGVILFILVILSIGRIIDYTKATSAMAKTDTLHNKIPEEVIEQSDLVDTSKLSPEELKKLNEKELKKVEEKKDPKRRKIIQISQQNQFKINIILK